MRPYKTEKYDEPVENYEMALLRNIKLQHDILELKQTNYVYPEDELLYYQTLVKSLLAEETVNPDTKHLKLYTAEGEEGETKMKRQFGRKKEAEVKQKKRRGG